MAAFLDVCERRRALRVIWELRGGALTFRGLRAACGGASPGVLQGRLNAWRALGMVEHIPRLGYRLTAQGERLFLILARLEKWTLGLPRDSLHLSDK